MVDYIRAAGAVGVDGAAAAGGGACGIIGDTWGSLLTTDIRKLESAAVVIRFYVNIQYTSSEFL